MAGRGTAKAERTCVQIWRPLEGGTGNMCPDCLENRFSSASVWRRKVAANEWKCTGPPSAGQGTTAAAKPSVSEPRFATTPAATVVTTNRSISTVSAYTPTAADRLHHVRRPPPFTQAGAQRAAAHPAQPRRDGTKQRALRPEAMLLQEIAQYGVQHTGAAAVPQIIEEGLFFRSEPSVRGSARIASSETPLPARRLRSVSYSMVQRTTWTSTCEATSLERSALAKSPVSMATSTTRHALQ